MTGFRVMTYWTNQGEDLAYTIVQPISQTHLDLNVHPLIHFGPTRPSYAVAPMQFGLEALKQQLRAMLEACDLPHLHMEPERVIPAKVVPSSPNAASREDK